MSEQLQLDRSAASPSRSVSEIIAGLGIDLDSLDHNIVFDEVKLAVADRPLPDRSWEDGADDEWVKEKAYSHSDRLRQIVGERIGKLAVQNTVDPSELFELKVGLASLKDRFLTSLGEMIQTHPKLRETIQHNYERRHMVRNGHMMALDGETKMSSMIERGYIKALQESNQEANMLPLRERCAADIRWLQRGEEVPVGTMWFGMSVYTKNASSDFYKDLGWREHLSFKQWIYRISEDELIYGSYSVDPVDAETIRQAWQEDTGVEIPRHEATDTWLDYSTSMTGTLEECRERILSLRKRIYSKAGDTRQRSTGEEILAQNKQASDEIFNTMYLPLTVAVEMAKQTGQKDPMLQTFTQGLLDDPEAVNSKIYDQLLGISKRNVLATEDADLLEQLVRYASAQHFCEPLIKNLEVGKKEILERTVIPLFVPVGAAVLEGMAKSLAMKVLVGAREGITYGGCTKTINLASIRKLKKGDGAAIGADDEYSRFSMLESGNENENETAEAVEESDKFGPLSFSCPKGHSNTRPRARSPKDFREKCRVCSVKLKCVEVQELKPSKVDKPIFRSVGGEIIKLAGLMAKPRDYANAT